MPEQGMSVNYAEQYFAIIDEEFSNSSLTEAAINDDYEFNGVNTVNVYSIPTVPLNDYDMSASSNRYGNPVELGNDVQTLVLTQDKSFSFTIDRRNNTDTAMTLSAGSALGRQIRDVIVPTVDKYRLSVLFKEAKPEHIKVETPSKTTAYEMFLDASTTLFDAYIPSDKRVAFVCPAYYKLIKMDKSFTSIGDRANDIAIAGVVGMVDRTSIIVTPTDFLPEGVNFIITHPMAMTSPTKIAEYNQHENAPSINGWLCEGRIYYDAFVLNKKRAAIYVSKREPEPKA